MLTPNLANLVVMLPGNFRVQTLEELIQPASLQAYNSILYCIELSPDEGLSHSEGLLRGIEKADLQNFDEITLYQVFDDQDNLLLSFGLPSNETFYLATYTAHSEKNFLIPKLEALQGNGYYDVCTFPLTIKDKQVSPLPFRKATINLQVFPNLPSKEAKDYVINEDLSVYTLTLSVTQSYQHSTILPVVQLNSDNLFCFGIFRDT